jgi:hypothetical protein
MPCKICKNPISDNMCEVCVSGETGSFVSEGNGATIDGGRRTEVNMRVEIPVPKNGTRIDKAKTKFIWTKNEKSPEIARIKEKIIEATERVSFEEFQADLAQVVEDFNKGNDNNGEPYAVLFDYKPHSSRRWVYELVKNNLRNQPQLTRHYGPAGERMKGNKLLEQNFKDGLKRFAVFDDAIYSGEQILNRTIKPIAEYYKQMGHPAPSFDLVVPFVTNRALDLFRRVSEHYGIRINVIYKKVMPSMREIMSDDEKSTLEQRGGKLDVDTEEPSYLGATVTYFDHRVADDHSFSAEVRKAAGNFYTPKPYADETTDYYKKEEEEFRGYQKEVGLV